MKEVDKKLYLTIILELIVCVLLTLTYIRLCKNDTVKTTSYNITSDTIQIPKFMTQNPKDGLRDALVFYDVKFPEIVYAQAVLETGHFKSHGCLNDNNLFGLYNSKEKKYYVFNHWSESVKAYKNWIQRRYKPPNDYYVFLENINYASDSLYIKKLKQIVRKNESRRSIGASS